MNGFFKVEGFFFSFLNRIANLALLNIIFIIFCLPIVTIGPALSALYQVSLKGVDDAYLSVWKDYTTAFKTQFIPSSLLFLSQLLTLGALGLVLLLASRLHPFLAMPFFVLAGVFILLVPFIYASVPFGQKSLAKILKMAFYLMLSHVADGIVFFAEAVIILVVLPFFFPQSIVFLLFFGFSFVAYLQGVRLKQILAKFVNETLVDETVISRT